MSAPEDHAATEPAIHRRLERKMRNLKGVSKFLKGATRHKAPRKVMRLDVRQKRRHAHYAGLRTAAKAAKKAAPGAAE